MLRDNAVFRVRTQGARGGRRRRPRARGGGGPPRPAAPGLRRGLRPPARRALLLVRGLPVPRARGGGGRLLRALPRADGRVPRGDPHTPPGTRRATRGADLVAPGREVRGAGAGPEGRGVRARRGRARRGGLLHRERRRAQALPHEVARGVVLEPRRAAAHHPRPQGGRRGRDHGLRGPRVRRGGSLMPSFARHALEAAVVLGALVGLVAYVTLLERKFAARLQSRIGPYYVGGPHGWLQPIAGGGELMLNEGRGPGGGDPGGD